MLDKNELIKKATICYRNQTRRCYAKSNSRYKDNGAKGIAVLYSLTSFIDWYLRNYKEFDDDISSVGRIDHSKSYSLDNIRFESRIENTMERIKRVGPTKPKNKVMIIDYATGEHLMIADSQSQAGRLTGVHKEHISRYCSGKINKSESGYTFRYLDKLNVKFESKRKTIKYKLTFPDGTIYLSKSARDASKKSGLEEAHLRKYASKTINNKKGILVELIK